MTLLSNQGIFDLGAKDMVMFVKVIVRTGEESERRRATVGASGCVDAYRGEAESSSPEFAIVLGSTRSVM